MDPKLIFVVSAGGHLGFMQITKIAQSGHKGNQAGIVLGPPRNTNHQKNVIGKNISRSHNKLVKRPKRLEGERELLMITKCRNSQGSEEILPGYIHKKHIHESIAISNGRYLLPAFSSQYPWSCTVK